MRNLFDQYSQPENQVTHALLSALNEDRRLLRLFLHELVKAKPPVDARKLVVLEQQYPGGEEPSEEDEEELDRRGIPDGWIVAEEQARCVLIESKVLAPLSAEQIERHRRTAARRGFNEVVAVAITPRSEAALPQHTVMLELRDVYAWLRRRRADSFWGACAADAHALLPEDTATQEPKRVTEVPVDQVRPADAAGRRAAGRLSVLILLSMPAIGRRYHVDEIRGSSARNCPVRWVHPCDGASPESLSQLCPFSNLLRGLG